MKHLTVSTSFPIGSQQAKTALCTNKSVASRRAFKNVGIDPLSTMGIQKAHKIKKGLTSGAHRAILTNIMPGAVIYRSSIFRAHISILRLPILLVQSVLALKEFTAVAIKLKVV